LRDCGPEGVEHAGVLTTAHEPFESRVHFPGILFGELPDGMDSEEIEIAEHCGADGDKVLQALMGVHGGSLLLSLSVRHKVEVTRASDSDQEISSF
jgi:hypothetical protein